MKFNLSYIDKLSKEFLLSKYPEETYMEFYLGIPVKKGLFRNPLRHDINPTCSFFRGKSGDLLFRDFSGVFNGNFIDVVMAKYNVTYNEALQIIANDFGILPQQALTKHPGLINKNPSIFKEKGNTKIQVEVKDFTEDELDWWNTFGITRDILKKYNVYSCKSVFLNDTLLAKPNMCFGYFGGFNNDIELWRIYFPLRKRYRFITNWPATKIQGWEQLPKSGNIVVITKSMKDVMTFRGLGIAAIAPNSENLFISSDILEELKGRFKHVVCFYDNDLPGIANMCKIKKEYPKIAYMWIPRKYNAKDISDFRKMYGRKDTLKLIKTAILKLKKFYGTVR